MQSPIVRLFASAACAAIFLAADDLDQIQRVENGLRAPIAIKGQPIAKSSVSERMNFYHVSGISVAVIDGGKVNWARGYGVTSADGVTRVTAETLFQAASISKHVAAITWTQLDRTELRLGTFDSR
jgi:CubicO group peptidase (beta-lactamase class C family)